MARAVGIQLGDGATHQGIGGILLFGATGWLRAEDVREFVGLGCSSQESAETANAAKAYQRQTSHSRFLGC